MVWQSVRCRVNTPEYSSILANILVEKNRGEAASYLQQTRQGDQAPLLPTAQPEEAVSLLVLPHTDLWRMEGGREGRGDIQ